MLPRPNVEKIVVTRGRENIEEADRAIATVYIFSDPERAEIVYTELRKRAESVSGEYVPSGMDMEKAMSGLRALGVERIVFLDAREIAEKLTDDELKRAVIVAYVMPDVTLKERYLSLLRMAKRLGFI